MPESNTLRVRFAPSPTGSLHLGGVRTALYNYMLASHAGGAFIIRVEDTDLDRNQDNAAENQLADLKWLGLNWSEGPDIGGDYGPYRQSQRQEVYQKYADQLVKEGKAFYCFLSDEELKSLHSHEVRQVKSPHRDLSDQEVKEKIDAEIPYVIRFRNDYDDMLFEFEDQVHGMTKLKGDMVGDFVLIRSNGQPVYNFCCAIDDHLMKISHVLRGEEHLSNTLRQLMVYKSLNMTAPIFGHLSMILGPNRKKLSKRDDAVSLSDFIQGGYLPEALLNYVALLGWSAESGEEKFTLDEMSQLFSMSRVHKSPAMFDRDKLNWLNHYHLGKLSAADVQKRLSDQVNPNAEDIESIWFERFWGLIGHQFNTLVEVQSVLDFFDIDKYNLVDKELVLGEGRQVVSSFKEELESYQDDNWSPEVFDGVIKKISKNLGVSGRRLFAPIRVSLIGVSSGMELKVLSELMSKSDMEKRLSLALSV